MVAVKAKTPQYCFLDQIISFCLLSSSEKELSEWINLRPASEPSIPQLALMISVVDMRKCNSIGTSLISFVRCTYVSYLYRVFTSKKAWPEFTVYMRI